MIVYEVSLQVDRDIAVEYLQWLHGHIAQILALPGFVDAQLFDVLDDGAGTQRGFVVCYRLHDRAALQRYFDAFAPALRADGQARFGGRFSATRRALEIRNAFPASVRSP